MKKYDTVKYAFVRSLPVLFGYEFLGIAFGIVLNEAGYGPLWAFLSSLFIFAGSAQFAMASLVASGASIPLISLTTLFINSRHIFYGLSFVEVFKKMKQKWYMIFSLTDETYSVLTLCKNDSELYKDNNKAMFLIAIFNQFYWVSGSVIGSLVGRLIPFDFTGIDFSMTALFIVILVDNIRGSKSDKKILFAALAGLGSGSLALLIFGSDSFLLPALLVTILALFVRNGFDKKGGLKNDEQ